MSGVEIPTEALAGIRSLYERGQYLQAYEQAKGFGPLASWSGTAARVMAGRLALNLGANRLGSGLHLRAWRLDRSDPEAALYCAYALAARWGPLKAWAFIHGNELAATTPPDLLADWRALRAAVAASLRDFDAAEEDLAEAKVLAPRSPWIAVQEAFILEQQDRYDEALDAARRSLEIRPLHRPGVQAVAWLLLLFGRLEEARDFLAEASRRIECGEVVALLANVQSELEDFAGAAESVARYERLMPLAETSIRERFAALRSDLAYHRGDLASAADLARQAKTPFHLAVAERLSSASAEEGRVRLPIPFIRQHHLTCSPATLSAMSQYWSRPVDHLSLARDITYEGTPGHKARTWFAANGWVTLEFRVTWEASVLLLDRGIPFTLVTVSPTNAHEQAVVGYDKRRRSLLIRDPTHPLLAEAAAEELLAGQQDSGPRGFVILPRERPDLLEGVDLPDAALYDKLHEIETALAGHDRTAAVEGHRALAASHPDHILTLAAARQIGFYDMDPRATLEWAGAMLQRFPGASVPLRVRVGSLSGLGRHRESLDELATLVADKRSDPCFLGMYAGALGLDGREEARALRWLRKALRRRPNDAELISTRASILWRGRRFGEALPLYRFAACLEDQNESRAAAYFGAARPLGRVEEVVDFLRRRHERFGQASSLPLRSLFWALEELGRAHAGFEYLERALEARRSDPELLLFAASAHVRYGDADRALALLEEARGKSRQADWARTAADIMIHQADLSGALRCWLEVLAVEPLAVDAHREVARLLASSQGAPAAVEHLRSAARRFPYHYGIHLLLYEWVRQEEDASRAETVLRRMLEAHPVDAWAHRELALLLADQKRLEEASAHLKVAGELEPASPSLHFVRGKLLADAGHAEKARAAFREALQLEVAHGASIVELVELCPTSETRREALEFVRGEMLRQAQLGDSLAIYRHRWRAFPPEEVLTSLRRILEDRPDQWQAWNAVAEQLNEMGRFGEAVEVGREAAIRFPLVHQVWLSLAETHRLTGELDLEVEALEKARQTKAGRAPAVRRLASIHEERKDFGRARALLDEALARDPLDAVSQAGMADLLWRTGEREKALEKLERALSLEPGHTQGWELLAAWCTALGRPGSAVRVARALTARRPGEARSWMVLARMLRTPPERPEALAALEKAISLSPRWVEAHDLRAILLAEEHRFDEALAACRPPAWGDTPPCELQGRAAWVEAWRGDIPGAIMTMRSVVAREPSYEWGWTQLAEWHAKRAHHDLALRAASRLVELSPSRAEAYGWRGHARRQLGDSEGARADFRRALELDQRYAYARTSLVEVQLDDGDVEGAAATLSRFKPPSPDDTDLALEARIAVRRRHSSAAAAAFRQLVRRPGVEAYLLDGVLEAFYEAGWRDSVQEIAADDLATTGAPPDFGETWVSLLARHQDWKGCRRCLGLLAPGTESHRRTLLRYVHALGDQRQGWPLRRCLWRHRDELRRDSELWATAGYALFRVGRLRAVRRWLSDWRERSKVQPWMIYNLALATGSLAGWRAGLRVHEEALRLPPDHTTPLHGLRVAFEEALEGRFDRADEISAGAHPAPDDPQSQALKMLMTAMLALERGERDFGWFKTELQRAQGLSFAGGAVAAFRHFTFRCAWRMARRHGSFRDALWAVLH